MSEVTLEEMLEEPIVQLMMKRDGVTDQDIFLLAERYETRQMRNEMCSKSSDVNAFELGI